MLGILGTGKEDKTGNRERATKNRTEQRNNERQSGQNKTRNQRWCKNKKALWRACRPPTQQKYVHRLLLSCVYYRYVARYARSDIGPLLVPRRGVYTSKRAWYCPVGLDGKVVTGDGKNTVLHTRHFTKSSHVYCFLYTILSRCQLRQPRSPYYS